MRQCEICGAWCYEETDNVCAPCAYKAKLREQLLRAAAVRRGDTK